MVTSQSPKTSGQFRPSSAPVYLFGDMEFVKVPAGKFLMGNKAWDAKPEEKPQHEVDIQYDFWIGRFPVMVGQYAIYCRSKNIDHECLRQSSDLPVGNVSWFDALAFCKWMNVTGHSDLVEGYAFILPSEAEWEKAARGLNGNKWPWGNKKSPNCNASGISKLFIETSPVWAFSPQGDSPFGAADMVGNVSEWTRSLWGPAGEQPSFSYPYRFNDGRESTSAPTSFQWILRGGYYLLDIGECRCSRRSMRGFPDKPTPLYGFRIALSPAP